jgi:hypothetical protein
MSSFVTIRPEQLKPTLEHVLTLLFIFFGTILTSVWYYQGFVVTAVLFIVQFLFACLIWILKDDVRRHYINK